MSLAGQLRHRVTVYRPKDTGDEDDYGHPVLEWVTVTENLPTLIQPLTAREIALERGNGPVLYDHRLFFVYGVDITTHDEVVDADGRRFELRSISDAGGQAQHYEVGARRVDSTDDEVVPVGS